MKTKWMKRLVLMLITAMMTSSCIVGTVAAADWDVKPSKTDYSVTLDNSNEIFLCNEGTIGRKVGTEIYLTYTVESMEMEKFVVAGVIGTNQPAARWPYVSNADGTKGGLLNHSQDYDRLLVEQGKTYFFKFTITEDGYKYRVGWAKGDEAEYIKLSSATGEVQTDAEYFGVWLATSGMTGKLTRVRCYDKYGNDLGVQVSPGKNVTIGREEVFSKDTEVNHRYTIELNDVYNVAISNKRKTTSDTVYMEYKVKEAKGIVYQWGAILGDEPTAEFPYLNGFMKYHMDDVNSPDLDSGDLLIPGAEYLIIMEREGTRFNVIVQRTYKGETINFSPDKAYRTYDNAMEFFSLWYAGPKEDGKRVSAVLENFKCYDSNKNNLGVQLNLKKGVAITHSGEIEDYAGCEALYADEAGSTFFALYENKKMKLTKGGETKEGTFMVEDGILTSSIEGEKNTYEYQFQVIRAAEGAEYWRVHPCKLTFETGEGSEVETQLLNEENGYQPMRPTDPTLEGNNFEGWYTSEGEKFDFDRLLTRSVTLYAKWSDVAYGKQTSAKEFNILPYVYIAGGILILAAAGASGGMIIVRGKRDAGKDKKEKEN